MSKVRSTGLLLMVVCAQTAFAQSAEKDTIAAGRALAETLCGGCHAVGSSGASKLDKAPTFRTIAKRYSVWTLQESLAEGIVAGHAEMPEFVLNPDEINSLLTYWDTLTSKTSQTK